MVRPKHAAGWTRPWPAAGLSSRLKKSCWKSTSKVHEMPRQPILGPDQPDEERRRDDALRPRWLREVIGQKAVVGRLKIVLNACKKLREPLSHILFDGPPGLGKTTFA